MSNTTSNKATMTTQELINSIIADETEESSTIVMQDKVLRGYLNKVAICAIAEFRKRNTEELHSQIGV